MPPPRDKAVDTVVNASYAGMFGSVREPVVLIWEMFEALACKRKEAEFRPEIAIPMVFTMILLYYGTG